MERYWNGWSFLSRDSLKIMLGECPEAVPASQIGAHSWFVHVLVERVDELHEEVSSRGAEVISALADTPWGLREFVVRTPDGHRIVFAERIPESGQND